MSNTVHQLSYGNDLFFKYALSCKDEGSVYTRGTVIERVTGIRVKESTMLSPSLGPGIILDVHVKGEQNRHFNIEMQTTYKGSVEMTHFEFYDARVLNNQFSNGKKYRDLKPAYQITFVGEYTWNNRNLANQYRMCNEQVEKGNYYLPTLRTHIHMPAISDIIREKGVQRLSDLEQLAYLSENNGRSDILKSKGGLMKVPTNKYEEMRRDDKLQSAAMAIRMGEACYCYGLGDNLEEGKIKGEKIGIQKDRISLLLKLLESRCHGDCSAWLFSLNDEQMEAVSGSILVYNSFQELKNQVAIMK